jgi:nucleoside-diphosphate-sugar epimerase
VKVFITGGTGFVGSHLIRALQGRGHAVRGLVRRGSESRLPAGCEALYGDPFHAETYQENVVSFDAFVHLIGTPHPSPSKAAEFRSVDLAGVREAVKAAARARTPHFIYVSVAQPAPIMQAYIEVRQEGEQMIRDAGLNATILRPWYVLGEGRRWPYLLMPVYWVAGLIPRFREGAGRLGLVTVEQMTTALVVSVENPTAGVKVIETPGIRAAAMPSATARHAT